MNSAGKDPIPVRAAGGVVLRNSALVAIVQLRKNKAWVLPKGKLKAGEDALAAAQREAREETGHEVAVHEYLGEMASEPGARPKVVQFWRMQADGKPTGKLMRDVRKVKWLPLAQAVDTLSHANERAFLSHVGPAALQAARRSAEAPDGALIARIRAWLRRLRFPGL
jgi:8-oxo-dGTP diphosphatase